MQSNLLALLALSSLAAAAPQPVPTSIASFSPYTDPTEKCQSDDVYCKANNNGWKPAAASYLASQWSANADPLTQATPLGPAFTGVPESVDMELGQIFDEASHDAALLSIIPSYAPSEAVAVIAAYLTPALQLQATATGTPAGFGLSLMTSAQPAPTASGTGSDMTVSSAGPASTVSTTSAALAMNSTSAATSGPSKANLAAATTSASPKANSAAGGRGAGSPLLFIGAVAIAMGGLTVGL